MKDKKVNFSDKKFSCFPKSLRFCKRAISPVVATVLLLVLVFVLAAIVFIWARGFVGEQVQKFGKPVEQVCGDVNYEFSLFGSLGGGERDVEARNLGDVPIYSFEIKQIYGGDSKMKNFYFAGTDKASLGTGEARTGNLMLDEKEENSGIYPDSIIVYPRLLGTSGSDSGGKPFTCLDKGERKEL